VRGERKFQKGDRVQILKGPFSEFIGVVDRVNTAYPATATCRGDFLRAADAVALDFPDVKKL
jgi:transcription antitermination factor NusG